MHPRAAKQLAFALLIDEADERDAIGHLQLGAERADRVRSIALAGNDEAGGHTLVAQSCDGAYHQVDALVSLESTQIEDGRLGEARQHGIRRIELQVDTVLDDLDAAAVE